MLGNWPPLKNKGIVVPPCEPAHARLTDRSVYDAELLKLRKITSNEIRMAVQPGP